MGHRFGRGSLTFFIAYKNNNSERVKKIVNFKVLYLAQRKWNCLKFLSRLYFTHFNNVVHISINLICFLRVIPKKKEQNNKDLKSPKKKN